MAIKDAIKNIGELFGKNNVRICVVKTDGTVTGSGTLHVSSQIGVPGEKVIVVTNGQSAGCTKAQ